MKWAIGIIVTGGVLFGGYVAVRYLVLPAWLQKKHGIPVEMSRKGGLFPWVGKTGK